MNILKPDIFHNYLRYKDINDYLDYLNQYYNEFVTVLTVGKSFEGRPLKAIKIDWYKLNNEINDNKDKNDINNDTSTSNGNVSNIKNDNKNKRQQQQQKQQHNKHWILIESGTHAREWITISVALFCIYQLTEKHKQNKDLLENVGFFIIPLVNADGYEYTHEKNHNWRKNRRPIPNSNIIGADCNRNYDYDWNSKKCSSSTKEKKITYKGDAPFSEPETLAIKNVMQNLRPNLKFLLSLHSYSQSIMYPWGCKKEMPQQWKDMHAVAICGKNAIQKTTGRYYRCGSISKVTRKTFSGTIIDYAYGVENIKFSFAMELPSRKYGFHPPKEQIKLLASESWIGIKAMCQKVIEYYQINSNKKKINK